MPLVIQHIDAIARSLNRGVLFVAFDFEIMDGFDYKNCSQRNDLLAWFETHNIKVMPCGNFANENIMESYRGQLFIDVPYDDSNPDYKKLLDHLENPDGSMKIKGVSFCYLPLEIAMKNKHHDEPGFWDAWAERF